jgi:dolichol-phosphate mannosyltransferase
MFDQAPDDRASDHSPLPSCVVMLCTYNEAANLPQLFASLAQFLPTAEILVVDDNSPDGTADVVQQWSRERPSPAIHLLRREGKLGLGSATRDGLRWCLERGFEFVINMDADLSHNPESAPQLLAACAAPGSSVDVAIGSRYVPGGGFSGLSWYRQWLSRVLNAYATRALGLPIKDCSGSYRCYRVTALQELDFSRLTCDGYGFLEEILVALHRNGAQLCEVPIVFGNRGQGTSKLGLGDAFGALRVIHRLMFRRR